MTYYSELKISTNEIAGAVAMEILHDLSANNFTFSGFPAIDVLDISGNVFIVYLRCGRNNKEQEVSFSIPKKEAVDAAQNFQKGKRTGENLFKAVQRSLVELEEKFSS